MAGMHTSSAPRGPMGHGSVGHGARGAAGQRIDRGTWGRLFKYCRRFLPAVAVALICAMVGTVLTLLGPNMLSDITDAVQDGTAPNSDKLEQVVEAVTRNIEANAEAMAQQQAAAMAAAGAPVGVGDVDAMSAAGMGAAATGSDTAEGATSAAPSLDDLASMPAETRDALLTDVEVDGVIITGADQQKLLDIFSNLDMSDTEAAMAALDELPASVKSLVEPRIDMDLIARIALTLVAFYVASYVLSVVQGWIMTTVTQRIGRSMRADISAKINRLPMSYFNTVPTGDILSRITNDVDTLGQSLNQSVGTLLSAVVLFFGSLFMMITTNGWMTLAAVGASLLGFALMMGIMGRSQKYFVRQQSALGALSGHIEESYTGHSVIAAYNAEDRVRAEFDCMNGELVSAGFRAQCLSGLMMPIMMFIGNFGYVAVCVVGGALALDGQIGFGVIVAFMLYVRYFTQPLSQIAQGVQALQSAGAAGTRVFEFLEAREMADESAKPARRAQGVRGEVEFDHVRFTYAGSDKPVIKDFSAHALPGQKVAIVGPTGAGKTTMVNLLMRFFEIDGGQIRIDGVPTSEMRREDVHALFCMVLQDTWLFEGTVRENLVYCDEGVTDEEVQRACRAVGLDHFIRSLPHGYDTVLNDQVNLSQGQKQQMTIARAMIADKPMLILDEATSNVDTRTELKIQQAMDELMRGRTSFVIAHRLSTIKNADLILVMKEGDIIESGTHDELLAAGGFYADLYNSQFAE
ncbi:ABC transporter ATP-binding protein [Collinsella sp. BM28]|uniref:ABC transporter ATP-binding protein n=1 Tax=Collinsella sp. BM28 TaxID=3378285 RepID=UPI003891CAF7